MNNIPTRARHKGWLQKALIAIAFVEVTYLVLINVALSLPVTQTLVNRIKPEKFVVYWEQAWSWYPFRVHARGISANGQTSSQQWQVDAPAAAASIDILPLLWRTVNLSDVVAQDIEYYQRPRPRADKDYVAIRQYFPAIRDRAVDTTVPVRPQKKTGTGWKVVVDDAHASGQHHVWIHQLQSTLSGTLQTDVSYQSRGGPFSLSNGKADVELDSLLINNDLTILKQGQIKGMIEFTPFVPSENHGLKSLEYLHVDADIGAQLQDLDFLGFYLNNLYGMNMTGAGELTGHARYAAGHLLPPTDLLISARELSLNVHAYKVDGAGDVHISVSDATPDVTDVAIRFSDMALLHEEDKVPHFHGDGLELLARGTSKLFPREGRKVGIDYATVTVPGVKIPDLRSYQRYLPGKTGVVFNGGLGTFQGQAKLTVTSLRTTLRLNSDAAEVSLQDYRFTTDLDLGLNIDIPSSTTGQANVAGSYVRLDRARLTNSKAEKSRPWMAGLVIDEGTIKLPATGGPDYEQEGWSAGFELEKGRTVWEKPVVVEASGVLNIKDSRPFVAIFSNEKNVHKWLEKLLTVENIQGRADMTLANNRLVVTHAFVSSDNVDAGVKGELDADRSDGVFYIRFRKFDAVMKTENGERNIDVIGAKKTFSDYSPLR